MLFIDSPGTDPYFNLALEEYVFTELAGSKRCFLLWQNARTIVVGVHQNTAQEINASYVKENDIRVARRLTGGGAVYHDLGNLNYTIIEDAGEDGKLDFAAFAAPVVRSLAAFGVKAELSGRNDILIAGKKISGSAQMVRRGRILHHGCIMLDSNLQTVTEALRVRSDKYESKGIASVRSRVTTINAEAPAPITMEEFRAALAKEICAGEEAQAYELTEADLAAIEKLREEKYVTWSWNYGNSPDYNVEKERRFSGGLVTARMKVAGGCIEDIHFSGDFFGEGEISELEENLRGLSLEKPLAPMLSSLQAERYFHGITAEEISELLTD